MQIPVIYILLIILPVLFLIIFLVLLISPYPMSLFLTFQLPIGKFPVKVPDVRGIIVQRISYRWSYARIPPNHFIFMS